MRDTLYAFRVALRALFRSPAFTLAAVAALALGIGGSTVVFSVVDTLLLQPLPYGEPDRLVVSDPGPPWLLYEQWKTADVFDGMAAYNERAANVSGAGEPERVMVARVTPNFLSVVGVTPAIGRSFGPRPLEGGGEHVVLLTDRFWRRHFAGAPDVVGRTVTLDDQAFTVIGVLPRQFQTLTQLMPALGLSFDSGAAVLVPLLRDPLRREPGSTDLFWRGMNVVARLRAGVTLDQARAAASTIAKRVKLPPYLAGHAFSLVRVTDFVAGELPAQMAILAAAVGLLLLVAGANVANLLLARGTARRRELATRAALGASVGQLVRGALTETVVLALSGGMLGIAAAWGGVRMVSAYGGPVLARLGGVGLDLRVLAFTGALSVGVGLLVGIVPAIRLARSAPAAALQLRRGYERVRGPIPLSSVLVVLEVVLSLVLVVGAGLLTRDFVRLASADLGFRSNGVLTADVSLSRAQYPKAPQIAAFFADLLDRAGGLPGVRSAAMSSIAPAGSAVMSTNMQVEGATRGPNAGAAGALAPEDHEYVQIVGGNYFRTLSVPMLEGRPLDARDAAGSERVAVVNAAFALKYLGEPSPGDEAPGHDGRLLHDRRRCRRPARSRRDAAAGAARLLLAAAIRVGALADDAPAQGGRRPGSPGRAADAPDAPDQPEPAAVQRSHAGSHRLHAAGATPTHRHDDGRVRRAGASAGRGGRLRRPIVRRGAARARARRPHGHRRVASRHVLAGPQPRDAPRRHWRAPGHADRLRVDAGAGRAVGWRHPHRRADLRGHHRPRRRPRPARLRHSSVASDPGGPDRDAAERVAPPGRRFRGALLRQRGRRHSRPGTGGDLVVCAVGEVAKERPLNQPPLLDELVGVAVTRQPKLEAYPAAGGCS